MRTRSAISNWSTWLFAAAVVAAIVCCGPVTAADNEPSNNEVIGREAIVPLGPGAISYQLDGSPAPPGLAFAALKDSMDPCDPCALIFGSDVYGTQVFPLNNVPVDGNGEINLRISAWYDTWFDGRDDAPPNDWHQVSGVFDVYVDVLSGGVPIWNDPCVFPSSIDPCQVVAIGLTGQSPGDTFNAWIDDMLPGIDPVDHVAFVNPGDPADAAYMPIGSPFAAEITSTEFEALLGWFNAADDPCLTDATAIPPPPPLHLPLINGNVPANGAVSLSVTGVPPAPEFSEFDGFHLGSGDYTLDLSIDTSAGQVFDLNVNVGVGSGVVDPAGHVGKYYFDPCNPGDAQVVQIIATPSADFQVQGWSGADAGGSALTNTVTMTSNRVVTVNFECIPQTLTTSSGSDGTIVPAPGGHTFCQVQVVPLDAVPDPGFRVAGWTGIDPGSDALDPTQATVTMDEGKSVDVQFECIPRTLTTAVDNPQGGSIAPDPGAYTHCHGDEVALIATPNPGWEVGSWDGVDAVNPGDDTLASVIMTEDKDVTVTFARIQYGLTTSVVGNAGGTINPGSGPQNALDVVPLIADPCAGYKETVVWSGTDDDTITGTSNTVTMSGPRTVSVEYELVLIGPAFSLFLLEDITPLGANGSIAFSPLGDPCGTTFAYDPCTVVSLTATPAGGFKVGSWTGPVDNPGSTALTNQVTMFGESQLIQVGATFDADPLAPVLTATVVGNVGGGYSSPAITPSTRYTGEIVDLVAAPDAGWQVVGWGGDAANQPAAGSLTNSVTMDSDKEVTVEYEPSGLNVTEMSVKADKDRSDPSDSFKFEGDFEGNEADLAAADSVIVSVSGQSWPLPYPSDMWKQKGSKYSYKNSAAKTTGGISKLVLEFTNSGICTVQAKNVSLAGLQAPVEVTLQFGAFAGADLVSEDVVNGEKKLLPICLLSGVQDALEPDKAPKLKNGESISIGGGIASSDPVDLSAIDVTIIWAGGAIVIPAGGFEASGDKWVAKAIQDNQGVLDVTLDFIKCDFSIKISEANALPPTGELTVSFDGFSASKTWDGAAWVD